MIDLLILGDVLLMLSAVGVVVFAFSYAAFFNWRKTPAGRALMGFVLMLVAIFVLSLVTRTHDGNFWGREWIRIILYSGTLFASWRLVWTLWTRWKKTPTARPKAHLDETTGN